MGLQSQLNDVSSDSIPLLLIALIANCVSHLRSFLFSLFHASSTAAAAADDEDAFFASTGSELAGLVVLADQLNLNRLLSHNYSSDDDNVRGGSKCVVCLCTMRDGELLRELRCRHVFHKDCFDGWLHRMNFDCPLCRSPLAPSDDRVDFRWRMRLGGELVRWFSFGMM